VWEVREDVEDLASRRESVQVDLQPQAKRLGGILPGYRERMVPARVAGIAEIVEQVAEHIDVVVLGEDLAESPAKAV